MSIRLKRVLTVFVGCLLAAASLLLGLWQMSRYQVSMEDVSAERASQPSVALVDNIRPDGTMEDIYGRRTTFSGEFLDEQLSVGTSMPMRQVAAFQLDSGQTLAVVLGQTSSPGPVALPDGPQSLEGTFTAGDQSAKDPLPDGAPEGSLTSLRLQSLVQGWPQPMVSGYVTLNEAGARAVGLEPAEAELPEGQGSAMHQGYALQWWVFAAAFIGFSIWIARGYEEPGTRRRRVRG